MLKVKFEHKERSDMIIFSVDEWFFALAKSEAVKYSSEQWRQLLTQDLRLKFGELEIANTTCVNLISFGIYVRPRIGFTNYAIRTNWCTEAINKVADFVEKEKLLKSYEPGGDKYNEALDKINNLCASYISLKNQYGLSNN